MKFNIYVITVLIIITQLIIQSCNESTKTETKEPMRLNIEKIFAHNHNLMGLDSIGSDVKTIQLQKTLINKRVLISHISSFNIFAKDSNIYLIGLVNNYTTPFKFVYAKIKNEQYVKIISNKDLFLTIGLLVNEISPSFDQKINRVTKQMDGEDGGYYDDYTEELITTTTVKGEIITVLP
ncbi:MAG: hypothetical protein ACOVSR_15165 [Bacteroidia bacterium]